ncbi:hypothetical protein ACMATS_02770 [Streptoverticillium reticulum]|uniref:hypothetical protein n=1 Tax=Streptoverticillium reticulum TaxID=1433415 RepID=UPI0039BF1697
MAVRTHDHVSRANHPTSRTGYSDAARIIADRQQWGDAMVYGERRTWLLDAGLARLLGDRLPRDVFLDRTDYAECLGDKPPLRLWVLTAGENSGPFTQDAVKGAPPSRRRRHTCCAPTTRPQRPFTRRGSP